MSTYNFIEIERKWQNRWKEQSLYTVQTDVVKPKFYVLDMFPYPSGAGLHVGHPLGYIASDIVTRYKHLKGFNVLHPMGFDAFGLPAEQYAVQTGQHPAITTADNIKRYKEQLNRLGFAFDWNREVQTCDPEYYKWTQWIFTLLFKSWYNQKTEKAESIDQLISIFEIEGNVSVIHRGDECQKFTAEGWENFDSLEKENILQCYRLAFQKETTVNWCQDLGTVLANEEVKDGKSERGGYPVIQKKMRQWYLRISAYADRLLNGLNDIEWSESLKEIQRNWIGRSEGASIWFQLKNSPRKLEVFTTRPDTIYGSSFMVLAPEHELIPEIVADSERSQVEAYMEQALSKSERERMINKEISGCFTGAYALNPLNGKEIPVYLAEYVLSGYGTGAIMAVPGHDERDHNFARKFDLPIIQVVKTNEEIDIQAQSFDAKTGKMMNSEMINGLDVKNAIRAIIQILEEKGLGRRTVNYKLRDAGFSRQRYWGEPFPIVYRNGIPDLVDELPVELPDVESYKPTGTGDSPLAALDSWVNSMDGKRETDTMPGWAGSSWYFLRYMDPANKEVFAAKEHIEYWRQVDLYIGGSEHATGHLLYSRFWTKFLFDLKLIPFEEPFKKLVNQGMIQGESMLLNYEGRELHVPVHLADKNAKLRRERMQWLIENDSRFENIDLRKLFDAEEEIELKTQTEKMSKSKFNVVNPDDVCNEYGADTLRLYEMFLGPLEDSKPWSTKGIDGTHRFLRKLWFAFFDKDGNLQISNEKADNSHLRSLHKTIKKISEDVENHSFNTSVSQFMICLNELQASNCTSREIFEPLLILLSPFAPHIAEELWEALGNTKSIYHASWPDFDSEYLKESIKNYPISINGKTRTQMDFPINATKEQIEQAVLSDEVVIKWLEGKQPKKFIWVPGRIVNIVI